jgi:hypothetical protein
MTDVAAPKKGGCSVRAASRPSSPGAEPSMAPISAGSAGSSSAASHLHNFRRLRARYERDPEIHEAFLSLACVILCFRRPQQF